MDYQTRTANAMKKILGGHIVSELGLYELPVDFDEQGVSYMIDAGKGIKGLQNLYMKRNPHAEKEYNEFFTSNKNVLIAEIVQFCFSLHEDYLEDILDSLKRNTDQ